MLGLHKVLGFGGLEFVAGFGRLGRAGGCWVWFRIGLGFWVSLGFWALVV